MDNASIFLEPPTFDNRVSGFGIENTTPEISWRFLCKDKNLRSWQQHAYEIEVQRNDLLEAYRVESHQSVRVPWPSTALSSREKAAVRVKSIGSAFDHEREYATEWSEWSPVETGLLGRDDWQAQLIIGQQETHPDKPIRPILLRRSFETPGNSSIRQARLYVTAQGVYQIYLNGTRVGDYFMAPGFTSYQFRCSYHMFDVTDLIYENKTNILAAEVGEGWFASQLWREGRQIYGKDIGLIAQLEISFENDSQLLVVKTDDQWEWNVGPMLTSEIYNGETFDMSEEQPGWKTGSQARSGTRWRPVNALPLPSVALSLPDGPPARATLEIPPQKTFQSPSGKLLLDFGQNLVGVLRIRSLNKPAGHRVSLKHAEVLEHGEIGMRPLRAAKCTDTIICSGKELKDWSPTFTFHGFRFVEVTGWSPEDDSSPLTVNNISATVIHSDMTRTGWFSCSDSQINRLHENSVWSMRGNFLWIPTDCPQRDERLGWTGDIQAFSPTANFLYNTNGILADWLADLALEQKEDNGIPPMIVPNVQFAKESRPPQAVWGDASILVPWALFKFFGDKSILERQYESMTSWLDRGCSRGEDGLWTPSLWQHGDWLDPSAPPEDPGNGQTDGVFVADAYLVYVTGKLGSISEVLGRPDDAARYNEDHTRLKRIFQEKYVTPKGMVMCDTQTSLALALYFSLLDTQSQIEAAGQRLARKVRFAKFRVGTGFAGTPIVTHALSETNWHQLAYRMLLETSCPSWLYPVTMGATTTWERWNSMLPDGTINPGQMTSFNHYALGSVANWLHEKVGGLSVIEPGWRVFKIRPIPGGTIRNAHIQYESPYGRIRCSWSLNEESFFSMNLTIPPNSYAWVFMPDAQDKGTFLHSGQYEMSCPFHADPWPPQPLETLFKPPARKINE